MCYADLTPTGMLRAIRASRAKHARYNDLPLSVGDAQPNRAPEDPTTHTKPAEPKEDA